MTLPFRNLCYTKLLRIIPTTNLIIQRRVFQPSSTKRNINNYNNTSKYLLTKCTLLFNNNSPKPQKYFCINVNSNKRYLSNTFSTDEAGPDDITGTEVSSGGLILRKRPIPEDMSIYPPRPPIVTIMGHVDHGKTTLLDALRKSSVAAGEAGGITQHIGAFSVELPSKQTITFLDTPGHAAFSAMRARGAHVTDIVVLVVAADDGVMPQTLEAIQHAKDAKVPMVVAINKIDKHNANTRKVCEALLSHGVDLEEFGGETQVIKVSGLKGLGLDHLEDAIIVLAELMDLRAEVDIGAEGVVIESQIEKGRGNVATILVKRGTLKIGSVVVAGTAWCRVRSMIDDKGRTLKKALPGTPVRVIGWKDLPQAGDEVLEAPDEDVAKEEVQLRQLQQEQQLLLKDEKIISEKRRLQKEELIEKRKHERNIKKEIWMYYHGLLSEYPKVKPPDTNEKKDEDEKIKEFKVVVKADVSGTTEAVVDALEKTGNEEIRVNIVHYGVGNITDSDIQMASTVEATIIGFNVKADKKVQNAAKQADVEIIIHNVIYKLLDEVKARMSKLLPPILEIHVTGEATILQVFELSGKRKEVIPVAGCRIGSGRVLKNQKCRIMRGDKIIWEGKCTSFMYWYTYPDITEATKGIECGMSFDGFTEFKAGDLVQSFYVKEIPRTI
ncbi:5071_t:CDS:10 [Ambispora leptoticha]|uniref:Translation initiation factor IF-2, mitochondrial n=1 Tax=Ambispora leptoticha TaxID=144679 RepID=A0A9N8V6X9_9GLOM|nr:5071_t:CDS:10 [Ambispora leptoticha]